MTEWRKSHRYDPPAKVLADRHYSRQKPDSPQFVAPGRNLVLLSRKRDALWVSLWQAHAFHAWKGAWSCSLFRNEGDYLSSLLIIDAVAYTLGYWGPPPEQGFITFVAPDKIRRKRDPGRCFLRAGWEVVGETKKGLVVLQLLPEEFPPPLILPNSQLPLLGGYDDHDLG